MKINKKLKVEINGFPQKIHLWGEKESNPIILFVHGGPGNPFRHRIRKNLLALTDSYIIAAYDQRGAGGSYKKMDPKDLKPRDYVFDIIEWAKWLTLRFHQKQVYLVGESWGSFIGSLALLMQPSLFKGYIGYGQVVDMKASLAIQYEMTLEEATKKNDSKTLAKLKEIGAPVDGKFLVKNGEGLFYPLMYKTLEKESLPSFVEREIKPFYHSIEYSIFDKINWSKGKYLLDQAMPYWETQLPSLYGFHDYDLVYKMPYYVFQGEDDFITPYCQLPKYLDDIVAPKKELVPFKGCGHTCAFDDPKKFMEELRKRFI